MKRCLSEHSRRAVRDISKALGEDTGNVLKGDIETRAGDMEAFLEYQDGIFVWIINGQVYKYYVPKTATSNKPLYKVVKREGFRKEILAEFDDEENARETRDEWFRVLAAQQHLDEMYSHDDGNGFDFSLKVKKIAQKKKQKH